MSDLQLLNGWTSLFCALVLSALVLSDRVKDGVIIKAGLIAMIGSFFVTAMLTFEQSRDWEAYAQANLINRIGILIALGGGFWRSRSFARRSKKKSTAHSERTNQQLYGMTEPAHDLMDLFIESSPTPLEKEKHGRTKV